ncbi:MAG: hypothetical protein IKN24_07645 [Lachnospiraceae bacterium]|nr:hypothetical protein [Lachnospiraceae bacterium]
MKRTGKRYIIGPLIACMLMAGCAKEEDRYKEAREYMSSMEAIAVEEVVAYQREQTAEASQTVTQEQTAQEPDTPEQITQEPIRPDTQPATQEAQTDDNPVTDADPDIETTTEEIPTEPAPSAKTKEQVKEEAMAAWSAQVAEGNISLLSSEEHANLLSKLSGTVFVGDSVTQALVTEGMVPESMAFFKRGVLLKEITPYVEAAASVFPEKVVFFKGLGDVDHEDPVSFCEKYAALVNLLRERVPGVKIYICALLPPSNAVAAAREDLARSWMFDDQLRAWCPTADVTYIDLHWMVSQPLYLADGIHFNKTFYNLWLKYVTAVVTDWEDVLV